MTCDTNALKSAYDDALLNKHSNPVSNPSYFLQELRPFFKQMGFDAIPVGANAGKGFIKPFCIMEEGRKGCKAVAITFQRNEFKQMPFKDVPQAKLKQLQKHMAVTGADVGFIVGEVKPRLYDDYTEIVHVYEKGNYPRHRATIPLGKISEEDVKKICEIMKK